MRHTRGRAVEVESLSDFDRRLALGAATLSGWHLQAVDLRARSDQLRRLDVAGALFLGCVFAPGDEGSVRARGGLVFPELPEVPVDVYRSQLYSPDELYDAPGYADTLDARTFAWSRRPQDLESTLAAALHDHAIDDALTGWVRGRVLVGVMGGHELRRGTTAYSEAARLGHLLGASAVVATGGGPGAMEAANLGGYLAGEPTTVLDEALDLLSTAPEFRPDVGAWVAAALEVRRRFPDGSPTLGIPTWHYGHEPPNPFATAIAKYFRNAPREAILLEVCTGGTVFLPGAGGTVQEIFQDACENYYADESSVAPMVLVGHRYWTEEMPAWPLLLRLSRGRPMAPAVHLVDSLEEAAAAVNGST